MVHSDVKYSPVATDESPRTGQSCLDAMLGAAPSLRSHGNYSALPKDEEDPTTSAISQPNSAGYWDAIKTAAASCRATAALYSSLPLDDTETLLSDAAGQSNGTSHSSSHFAHKSRSTRDHCLDMSCAEKMEEQEDYVLHQGLFEGGDTEPLIYDHTFQHKPPSSPLHVRVHTTCRYIKAQIRTTDRYVRTTLHTSKDYASDKMQTLLKSLGPFVSWIWRCTRLWLLVCLVLSVISITISSLALKRTNDLLQQEGNKVDHQTHTKLKEFESDFNAKLEKGHETSRKAHEKIESVNATVHEKVDKSLRSSAQAHEKIDQIKESFDAKLDSKHRSLDGSINQLRHSLNNEVENNRQSLRPAIDRISRLEATTYFGVVPEHTMIYILSAAVVFLLLTNYWRVARLN